MESDVPETKKCPFCAETIQPKAVKCSFCGEFLEPPSKPSRQAVPFVPSQPNNDTEKVLFRASPSLLALAGTFIRSIFGLALAAGLLFYPVENLLTYLPDIDLTEDHLVMISCYSQIAGLSLAFIVLLILMLKAAALKSTYYEVTTDRIKWARGIFSRKIDNLDMFRVVDLRLQRSMLDCIVGIGNVILITTDKTDPEFTFKKIRDPRILYDILKKASIQADKQQGVLHLE